MRWRLHSTRNAPPTHTHTRARVIRQTSSNRCRFKAIAHQFVLRPASRTIPDGAAQPFRCLSYLSLCPFTGDVAAGHTLLAACLMIVAAARTVCRSTLLVAFRPCCRNDRRAFGGVRRLVAPDENYCRRMSHLASPVSTGLFFITASVCFLSFFCAVPNFCFNFGVDIISQSVPTHTALAMHHNTDGV